MKKFLSVLVAASFLAAPLAVRADEGGDHHEDASITVQGEILDMACYVAHEAKGPDHAGCAKKCAKGGQPMGLLTEDGTVYLLYADHDDNSAFEAAKDLAGQHVTIEGKKAEQGGIKGLEVNSVEAG